MTRGERVRHAFLVTLAVFLIGLPVSADAAEPYIQLKDSTIIKGCEMKVHRALQSIMLYCGNGEQRVPFREVLKIVDSIGSDVTHDYIGRYDVLGFLDEEPEDSSPGVRSDSERLFGVGLSGQAIILGHASGGSPDPDIGLGVAISTIITTSKSSGIRLQLSHVRADIDVSSSDYKSTQFTAGMAFFDGSHRERRSLATLYGHIGLGGTHESPGAGRGSSTRLTVSGGVGMINMFSDRWGLDFTLGAGVLLADMSGSGRDTSTRITFRLGLIGLLGGYR